MKQQDCQDFYEGCRSRAVMLALEEDRYTGDVTTMATIDPEQHGSAVVTAKAEGVIAGLDVARQVFLACNPSLSVDMLRRDGERVSKGERVMEVHGLLAPIMLGERTALNFMQRMSGIATKTRQFVDLISHTGTRILDTRKTAPGLRYFDKEAVRIGGGRNHRYGLFDLILIKDNHIDSAGGVGPAINRARMYREKHNLDVRIEVEVRSLDELSGALACRPDIILLDNFPIDLLREAVEYVRSISASVELEASGNMSLETVRPVAETGVDFISVGELTHSVRALDLSMTITLD